jgi:hypothetical protein
MCIIAGLGVIGRCRDRRAHHPMLPIGATVPMLDDIRLADARITVRAHHLDELNFGTNFAPSGMPTGFRPAWSRRTMGQTAETSAWWTIRCSMGDDHHGDVDHEQCKAEPGSRFCQMWGRSGHRCTPAAAQILGLAERPDWRLLKAYRLRDQHRLRPASPSMPLASIAPDHPDARLPAALQSAWPNCARTRTCCPTDKPGSV